MAIKLIHIGQHKCASTFLQGNFFPKIKDANCLTFINKNKVNAAVEEIARNPDPWYQEERAVSTLLEYIKENQVNCISSEIFCGSGMELGSGLGIKICAERLHKIFPNTKILLIVREQRSILRSLYKDWICYGTTLSYHNWLNRSISDWRLNFCHYYGIAKTYGDQFGKENLKVVLYEELFNKKVMKDILDFSGLSSDGLENVDMTSRLNSGFCDISVMLARIINRFIRTKNSEQVGCYSAPELKVYDTLRYNIYPLINRIFKDFKIYDYQTIESNFYELILSIKEDNHKLADYLNRDISDMKNIGYLC